MIKSLITAALATLALTTPAAATNQQPPQWQGGLAPGSEAWWTGDCAMDWPAIHVVRTPGYITSRNFAAVTLHGHWTEQHSLVVFTYHHRRVVWDGVNLTNHLHRAITFAASCN